MQPYTPRALSRRRAEVEPVLPPDLRTLGTLSFAQQELDALRGWLGEGGWPRGSMNIEMLEGVSRCITRVARRSAVGGMAAADLGRTGMEGPREACRPGCARQVRSAGEWLSSGTRPPSFWRYARLLCSDRRAGAQAAWSATRGLPVGYGIPERLAAALPGSQVPFGCCEVRRNHHRTLDFEACDTGDRRRTGTCRVRACGRALLSGTAGAPPPARLTLRDGLFENVDGHRCRSTGHPDE